MSAGCPFCKAPTPRLLTYLSDIALVNYYRCDACGAVWNIPKDSPDAPRVIVTEGRHTADDPAHASR